jgi:hypothetical protein
VFAQVLGEYDAALRIERELLGRVNVVTLETTGAVFELREAADARLEGLPGRQRVDVEGFGTGPHRRGHDDTSLAVSGRKLIAELSRDRDPRLVIQRMEERPTKHRSPVGLLYPRPAHPCETTASEKTGGQPTQPPPTRLSTGSAKPRPTRNRRGIH